MPRPATKAAKAAPSPPASAHRRAPGRAGTPAAGRELRARGQRTVRNLLDAGIEVFALLGYHPARVDDIVQAADTSHGTFYLYFANKEDLFRALTLDVSEEMAALVDDLGDLAPGAAGYAALRSWLAAFGDIHARYGPVIKAWTEAEIEASEMGSLGAEVLGGLAAAIAARIAANPTTGLDPTAAALAIVAMVERFHYYVMSGQVTADQEQVLDTIAEVTYAALFGPRRRRTR